MLGTILNGLPSPKCVIVHDSVEAPGRNVLLSIVHDRINSTNQFSSKIHLFLFENPEVKFEKIITKNVVVHCFNNAFKWLTGEETEDFFSELENSVRNSTIIIDSLAHVIVQYGAAKTFKVLHNIVHNTDTNIVQLATVLHGDVLGINMETVTYYLDKLSTLSINLIPMHRGNNRVDYFYKKPGGQVIKEIEEYYFENDSFKTKALERPNADVLLANTKPEILPEELASFKIGLSEKDQKLKDGFKLPYLRSYETEAKEGGNIIYNLDENDDWDEEDPDDDLDI